VISDTIQEFLGVRYYSCGRYFQNKGRRLHRVVWRQYRGKIPKGHHVHHVDGDPSNNRMGNLKLVTPAEHRRIHGPTTTEVSAEARSAAAEWHGSEEGLQWHREQHEKRCRKSLHKKERRRCAVCDKSFWARVHGRGRFCSLNCRMANRRASGVDDEVRICVVCGTEFSVNRYFPNRTCSRSCGRRIGS